MKDSNVIHNLFAEYHYADDLGVIKSKVAEYVATVRREERVAAFSDAIRIAKDFRRKHHEDLYRQYNTLSLVEALERSLAQNKKESTNAK